MSNITLTISDDNFSVTYPLLEVPFTVDRVRGGSDIVTLDGNLSSYYLWEKKTWRHTWAYMSESEYLALLGFYERQWVNKKYPRITCSRLGVDNQPVLLTINSRNIVNNCGVVSGVEITMRETVNDDAVS